MSVAVHRTFVTLVLALVAALVMPLAAGAVVLPDELVVSDEVDGAPVVEEPDPGLLEEPTLVEVPDAVSPPTALTPDDEQDSSDVADGEVAPEGGVDGDGALVEPGVDEHADEPSEEAGEDGERQLLSGVPEKGRATHIATGRHHVLYLDPEGQIWSWGLNAEGQLGNGTRTSSNTPVRVTMTGVLADVDIVAVAAGGWHSMALDSEGRVYTWGQNIFGELGIGTTVSSAVPVRVSGLLEGRRVTQMSASGVLDVAAPGSSSTAQFGSSGAVDDEGRVFTWGAGAGGRLGIGASPVRQTTPALVGGLVADLRVVDVAVGATHSAVLSEDGRVFSWGDRRQGALGNGGGTAGSNASPVATTMSGALSGVPVAQLSAGWHGTSAIGSNRQIYGWGWNDMGQLGTGSRTDALLPVRADMAAFGALEIDPISVNRGYRFTLALGDDGRVAAWGAGANGQLGNGANANTLRAVEVGASGVMADAKIIQIDAGRDHAFALSDDGRIFGWGDGSQGQLGNGANSNSNVPVQVGGLRVVDQPGDVAVTEGEGARFSATSSEAGAAVRWESSTDGGQTWAAIEGATSEDHVIESTTREMDGTKFRVLFTSGSVFQHVAISDVATLTVREIEDPPLITVHPDERVRSLVDLEVSLDADAVGSEPMTVQWQSSVDDGTTWSDVAGATDKTHTFVATGDLDGTLFRAVFTNPAGSATTTHALLQVVLQAPRAHLSVTPAARLVTELGVT